jgi:hypothetical protein
VLFVHLVAGSFDVLHGVSGHSVCYKNLCHGPLPDMVR